MKGMAAHDTFAKKPKALDDAVFFHCLASVFGASRIKSTAMAEKRAQRSLIQPYKKYNEFFPKHGPFLPVTMMANRVDLKQPLVLK
jgi:hypothetical protein